MESTSVSSTILLGIVLIILVLLSSVFSSFEMAVTTITDYKFESYYEKRKKGYLYKINKLLIKNYNMTLSTILISNTLANVGSSTLSTLFFTNVLLIYGVDDAIALGTGIATGVITFIVLLFGEMIPKTLARKNSMFFLKLFGGFIICLYYLLWPINWVLNKIIKPGDERISEKEIDTLIDIVTNQNVLGQHEATLTSNALKFDDTTISSCIETSKEIQYVDISWPQKDVIEKFEETKCSRLIVKNKNKIIGYIHLKDIIFDKKNWIDKVRKITIVSQYMKLSEVLREMQFTNQHIVLVKKNNKSSSIIGIISLEEILEKLVGEIRDEKDINPTIAQIDQFTWKIEPETKISLVNKRLKTNIEFDGSLKEYIKSLGYKQKNHLKIKIDNLDIEIKKIENKYFYIIEKKIDKF